MREAVAVKLVLVIVAMRVPSEWLTEVVGWAGVD